MNKIKTTDVSTMWNKLMM